jgi:hypothetical protein
LNFEPKFNRLEMMAYRVMSKRVIDMRADQDLGVHEDKSVLPQSTPSTLSALRMAALRLADTRKKPKLKTRDLVGLLLSHSARAWRLSLPPVRVKVSVQTPNGVAAVRLVHTS